MSVFNPESRSIDFVPHAERFGHVRSLFTLWFGANMQVVSIAAGAISVYLGLSVPWAFLATVIGNLIGGVFMALHSAQGPILGIPQMIQSRAQFGFYGAMLPLLFVILMYIGFSATTTVQGGLAFASLTGFTSNLSIALVAIVTGLITIFGYRLIHKAEKWLSLISGLAFLYLSFRLVTSNDFSRVWDGGGFAWPAFIGAAAIAVTWQLTYAPYVADYSRYLPAGTSVSASFWTTYLGSVLASVWMFTFGAAVTALVPNAFNGGSVDYIVNLAGGLHWLFFLIIIAGLIGVNSMDIYGAFMSTTTVLNSLARRIRITPLARAGIIILMAAIATLIGVLGKDNFLHNFHNFILLLAYFLIPWTSINLVDFYLIRKEKYDVNALADPRGEYGGVDWRAMTAYIVGILIEIPFIASSFYTGPIANALGGADVSWVFGIFIAGGLYVVLMKAFPTRTKYPARTATSTIGEAADPGDDQRTLVQ
ncbi:purine-cytosine permease family protein [Rhodococcus sp. JT-3]|uniref:purine-cytosine permease family protein n=1 Tax=Rhodococcus sp. JT-3 TaxID=1973213 RepID=UPI0013039E5E|nr:cytosine permease [Rhodococcus sp. JT-3]